jgi:hypothetical protein
VAEIEAAPQKPADVAFVACGALGVEGRMFVYAVATWTVRLDAPRSRQRSRRSTTGSAVPIPRPQWLGAQTETGRPAKASLRYGASSMSAPPTRMTMRVRASPDRDKAR